MRDRLPALQFYPGDWRKDPGVQALTLEERAVWFEILLLMFESEDRGKLILNSRPYPEEFLATALHLDLAKLKQTLSKLVAIGVASVEQDTGVMFNRRMVRDNALRQARVRAGRLGGMKKASNEDGKRVAKATPSSSSSSSSSTSEKNPIGPKTGPAWGLCRHFRHCKIPANPTKQKAFEDLMRQGVSYESIKASGEDPTRTDWDFWDHVKALKPASHAAANKPCTACDGKGKIGVGAGTFLDCPKCRGKAVTA